MPTPRGIKLSHVLKLVLLSLLPAIVLVVGLESCSTLAIHRAARMETDPNSGNKVYTMHIGRFPWSRKSVTPLNSAGFPDTEFASARPKHRCVHVVFAGDSYVFGDGVDRDSSFVALLKSWTRTAGAGRCIRIFNLGERGTTIDRQAQRVREHLSLLEPDVVILGQYQNDLTDLTNPGSLAASVRAEAQQSAQWTNVRERFATFNLNLVRFISYHMFGNAIKRGIHYDLLKHWSIMADTSRRELARQLMGVYSAQYAGLVAELSARNIAFGAVIIPSKFDVLAGRFPEESFFTALAKRNGIPYLSTFPILDGNRTPYAFLMYDGHLNERGNRLIAENVYRWLFLTEPAPFPQLRNGLSDAMANARN